METLPYDVIVVFYHGTYFIGKVVISSNRREGHICLENVRILVNFPLPNGKVQIALFPPPGYDGEMLMFPSIITYKANDFAKSMWLKNVSNIVLPGKEIVVPSMREQ